MRDSNRIEDYWQRYVASLPAAVSELQAPYTAEPFGDSPALANELAALIASRRKTATCSALWEWQAEGNPITEVGLKTIVLDGNDEPLCIIETIEVAIRPYNEVDAQFAFEEGEGDLSLEYWREAHWRFFTRTLSKIGKQPALDMPLVCERFRMIYR
jgi:uncharacterized protein YhfF